MQDVVGRYRALLGPRRPHAEVDAPVRADETRKANLSAALSVLHLDGAQSRSDLVNLLGVSRSTVGSLISELTDLGVVKEAGVDRHGAPGRPSQVVTLTGAAATLALEIGPADIGVATVEIGGRLHSSTRRALRRATPLEEMAGDISAMVRDQVDMLPEGCSLIGIGIAVAGLVDADGIIEHAPNLGWVRTDIREHLGPHLPKGVPIHVGNESTLSAVGEYLRGALRGVHDGVVITGDVGIGGGAIVDGHLLWGADAMAAEFGHMCVEREGRQCRCGSLGCWETVIGLEAIAERAGLRWIDAGDAVVAKLLERAQARDHQTLVALEETAEWLGRGLANLVNLLNPTRIVIGGRLGELFDVLKAGVDTWLDQRALARPRRGCDVAPAGLGRDAALIGAAELAFWNAITSLEKLLSREPSGAGMS